MKSIAIAALLGYISAEELSYPANPAEARHVAVVETKVNSLVNFTKGALTDMGKDIQDYDSDVRSARTEFRSDMRRQMNESRAVAAQYSAAWNNEASNWHVSPSNTTAGWNTLDLDNKQQVVNQWNSAIQADHRAGARAQNDLNDAAPVSLASSKVCVTLELACLEASFYNER